MAQCWLRPVEAGLTIQGQNSVTSSEKCIRLDNALPSFPIIALLRLTQFQGHVSARVIVGEEGTCAERTFPDCSSEVVTNIWLSGCAKKNSKTYVSVCL